MRRVNVWNVKGEKLPGRAYGRGGARALDPVVRRTRKRYLWGKVNSGRIVQVLCIHSMKNIARREASLESRVSFFAPDHVNTLAL